MPGLLFPIVLVLVWLDGRVRLYLPHRYSECYRCFFRGLTKHVLSRAHIYRRVTYCSAALLKRLACYSPGCCFCFRLDGRMSELVRYTFSVISRSAVAVGDCLVVLRYCDETKKCSNCWLRSIDVGTATCADVWRCFTFFNAIPFYRML